MNYDDDTPAARGPGLEARAPVQAPAPTTDADAALNELRRALLIYGTAGQASRPGTEVHTA